MIFSIFDYDWQGRNTENAAWLGEWPGREDCFKTNIDKFWQAICAFANDLLDYRKQGYLILGADDDGNVQPINITMDYSEKALIGLFN